MVGITAYVVKGPDPTKLGWKRLSFIPVYSIHGIWSAIVRITLEVSVYLYSALIAEAVKTVELSQLSPKGDYPCHSILARYAICFGLLVATLIVLLTSSAELAVCLPEIYSLFRKLSAPKIGRYMSQATPRSNIENGTELVVNSKQ